MHLFNTIFSCTKAANDRARRVDKKRKTGFRVYACKMISIIYPT
ncbi:hypothetical protein ASZ90_013712 [hydrocarbon metagenome]|uniref:Uncharacterized protein n=1 Tax=hydrocarbon metagenome TaxID=938273 RepID=A0A0W8F6Y7_9ZZZZ